MTTVIYRNNQDCFIRNVQNFVCWINETANNSENYDWVKIDKHEGWLYKELSGLACVNGMLEGIIEYELSNYESKDGCTHTYDFEYYYKNNMYYFNA